jgi:uncharacterized protein YbjT (DUF2867 family)
MHCGVEGNAMEFLTGATGSIGGRLLERLVADGREVRAVSRRPDRLEGPGPRASRPI